MGWIMNTKKTFIFLTDKFLILGTWKVLFSFKELMGFVIQEHLCINAYPRNIQHFLNLWILLWYKIQKFKKFKKFEKFLGYALHQYPGISYPTCQGPTAEINSTGT